MQPRTIQIRKVGTDHWLEVQVDLISQNRRSLGVSSEEALWTEDGILTDLNRGRTMLFLLKESEADVYYINIMGRARTQWEAVLGDEEGRA